VADVLLLGADGPATRMVYHALHEMLAPRTGVQVILEKPVARTLLLRRRAKRLGVLTVAGQLLFLAAVVPLLKINGRKRVGEIQEEFALDDSPIPPGRVHRIDSANSDVARNLIRRLEPAVIVVSGTRILAPETIGAVAVPVINMHAGITPAYRGVHGGYWALAEGRPELVGTTVHRVDRGIDTGAVIEQVFFGVTPRDSFWTYPYLHTAVGIPALLRAVQDALQGELPDGQAETSLPSVLRYHPTAWGYMRGRLARGVR
jgi:phosphoribosylglycinamide formyltransferase 1